MLTKQLQALIEVGLANGQSYDEIGGMLAIQGFSDSEITGLFDEYDAKMKGEKPIEEQYLGIGKDAQQQIGQTTPVAQEVPQQSNPASTEVPVGNNAVSERADTVLDLDASDDAISYVEEEAEEQAEYNLKTPSYLDKEQYEASAQTASMVAKTISQPVEKEVFDIDKDMNEEVAIAPTPQSSQGASVPPVVQPVQAAAPASPAPVVPQAEVTYKTPSIPVQNNIPQRAQPLTTHAATQSQPPTENMTQFTSTLATSCVGSDFTGKPDVDTAIMQKQTSTPPQLRGYNPAAQQAVPQTSAPAPMPASVSPVQQSYQPPQQAVQVGLGNIPELAAASQFAQQQAKGKSPAPVIIILVIVLAIIFGFMYWYYFVSDLRTAADTSEATVTEPAPLDPLQVDPFTGQLLQ